MKGNFKNGSDIDLTLKRVPEATASMFFIGLVPLGILVLKSGEGVNTFVANFIF